jgi:hypothetical protein
MRHGVASKRITLYFSYLSVLGVWSGLFNSTLDCNSVLGKKSGAMSTQMGTANR